MSKRQKLLEHCRNNPKGVSFDDLVRLVGALGFDHVRTKGDHMIFAHPDARIPLVNTYGLEVE